MNKFSLDQVKLVQNLKIQTKLSQKTRCWRRGQLSIRIGKTASEEIGRFWLKRKEDAECSEEVKVSNKDEGGRRRMT